MASRALKNLQNLLVDTAISQARFRIKEEAQKQIMKIKEQIPTKEDIKKMILDALLGEACTPRGQEILNDLYNKIHGLIEDLEKLVTKGVEALQSISDKLKEIETKVLAKIQTILEALNPVIIAMRIIIQVAPASLYASAGPASNGGAEYTIGNKIDLAFMYVAAYSEMILTYVDMIPKYIEKIFQIANLVTIVLGKLRQLLAQISAIKLYLEYLYLQFISQCNTDNDGSEIEPLVNEIVDNNPGPVPGGENFEEVSKQMTLLYNELLEELKIQGKMEVAEYLKSLNFGFNVQYRVLTVPIS
tara:strand:- start:222 stop:1127 length:906 start_codon:yes stop_codon:yes gene_type:complete